MSELVERLKELDGRLHLPEGVNEALAEAAARIAALEAEVAELKGILAPIGRRLEARIEDAADAVLRAERAEAELTRFLGKDWVCFVTERDARIATARADALEEAARVAEEAHPVTNTRHVEDALQQAVSQDIAAAIRALALTQPASTQPLTDQGETSTAGEAG